MVIVHFSAGELQVRQEWFTRLAVSRSFSDFIPPLAISWPFIAISEMAA